MAKRVCSFEGCGKVLGKKNKTGFCNPHFNSECQPKGTKAVAGSTGIDLNSAERLATNAADPLDRLKQDNIELRANLQRSASIIRSYQSARRFEDRLMDEIREFLEANPYRPQLRKPNLVGSTNQDHEMLALVSDAHFPEVVDPAQTFGIKYNADIFKRRLQYLRDKIIRYYELRAKSYPVRKLTLGVVGDMLSGNIHDELEATNQMPMSEALTQLAYMLHDFGRSIAEAVPAVEMIVMPGNHPRITKVPRFKQKWDNWEYVMGLFIQALAGDAFTVTVPKDLVYRHRIFKFTIGLTHGDGVKAQSFAGIPWYSMAQRRNALQSLLKSLNATQLDMLCYGHFHQLIFEEGQGCSLVINGSIKGGDEFATGTRYAAQSPVQALLTFHAKHGMTDLSRINLGHIQ